MINIFDRILFTHKPFYFLLLIALFIILSSNAVATDKGASNNFKLNQIFQPVKERITDNSICSPLGVATGNIIKVNPLQSRKLKRIVATAKTGDTILLEDGIYNLKGSTLRFTKPGITLRSASGNPNAVILDGSYKSREIIKIRASNITIAEISITRAFTHPIHIVPRDSGDILNTLIYRVNITDPREQAIKINPHRKKFFVDYGTIACSSIKLTSEGRHKVNPASGGCYTGGIDAHQVRGWTVIDNNIQGFWCPSGLSQHAIHFWRGSRDTTIERNILSNNARGIGLGMMNRGKTRTYNDSSCPEVKGAYIGHYNGIIINNFIHASSPDLFNSSSGYDSAISLWSACKAKVLHNTIVSKGKSFSSIDWRFKGSQGIEIYNNIVTHPLRKRKGASAKLAGNLKKARLSLFLNTSEADLHLKPSAFEAINKGVALNTLIAGFDIDNEKRDSSPDIGADEI